MTTEEELLRILGLIILMLMAVVGIIRLGGAL